MARSHHKQLTPMRPPAWLRRLPGPLRARVEAEVQADVESAAAIYRRWNLRRFIAPRTFREYVAARRRIVREYERTYGRAASRQARKQAARPGPDAGAVE